MPAKHPFQGGLSWVGFMTVSPVVSLPLRVIYAGLAAGLSMFLFCRFATPALPTRSCFVFWPSVGLAGLVPASVRLPM
jgi:hypothetical protein